MKVTARISAGRGSGRLPDRGADHAALTDEQTAAVTWLAIVINAWNRVAVFSHYPVAPTEQKDHP